MGLDRNGFDCIRDNYIFHKKREEKMMFKNESFRKYFNFRGYVLMKGMLNKKILALMFLLMFLPLVGCHSSPAPPNEAPIITSAPITTATVGEAYVYDVEATDPDGNVLTYSLTVKPSRMTINFSTGKVIWFPETTGSYDVTVKVSDGKLSDTQSFTITV